MPELDRLKEQLVYLRLRVGIVVVAEISLLGWLASAVETAAVRLVWLAIGAVILLGCGVYLLDRRIQRLIDEIGRL
ncbi:MAG: hypothetical protein ACT4P4_10350 [Betaproteobacteria bacterium]